MRLNPIAPILLTGWFLAMPVAYAQKAESPTVDPVSIRVHWNAARVAAGSDWSDALEFFCGETPDLGQRQSDPLLEPTYLFDNLAIFGRSGTVVYALLTSEGIVLLDTGYQGQEQDVLVAGLRKLGLDPEDIKYAIVAHGHQDHSGGAKYLQDTYGTRIIMSAADWSLVDQYPALEGGDRAGPNRDLIAEEGQDIVIGDTRITPILVLGHTPGSLGLIFEVSEGDQKHLAGLFGGTILLNERITDDGLMQYTESLTHFAQVAAARGVDMELQNHPMFNNLPARLEALKNRRPEQPNPFVIGQDAYQRLLTVMSECTKVELAERGVAD